MREVKRGDSILITKGSFDVPTDNALNRALVGNTFTVSKVDADGDPWFPATGNWLGGTHTTACCDSRWGMEFEIVKEAV